MFVRDMKTVLTLGTVLFFASANTFAAEIDLITKALRVQYTEYYPECGEDCVPFGFWHLYTVKVLNGPKEFQNKKIKLALLQNSPFDVRFLDSWQVTIEEKQNDLSKLLGTEYFIINHSGL